MHQGKSPKFDHSLDLRILPVRNRTANRSESFLIMWPYRASFCFWDRFTMCPKRIRDMSDALQVAFTGGEDEDKPLREQIEKTTDKRKNYVLDLKIFTPSSLLGYNGMSGVAAAPALVRLAMVKGLDVIAVTDLFSARSIDTIKTAAKGSTLTVIPGLDIRCCLAGCDDVILSCFFPEKFGTFEIDGFLRELGVPPQEDETSKYVVRLPFGKIVEALDRRDAAALPSRIDKTPHRLAALPSLIDDYGFRAFDLAYIESAKIFKTRWPNHRFALFSFSNASALAQVGSRIAKVKMPTAGFDGVRELVRRA